MWLSLKNKKVMARSIAQLSAVFGGEIVENAVYF